MASKVYFTDFRTPYGGLSMPEKLKKLCKKAGIENIDFNNQFVAIKMHFGEPGNISYLRPNYAKAVADLVKELGGKPFLTDCNTLYVGRRKHALEHIDAAYENGFNPFTTGCHVIIADGLKGADEAYVPVKNGELVKEAKIGRAIMDADIFISLTHFKGHEMAGFGGALKNIGMGGGSRAGKMEMHNDGKPAVNPKLCVGCGRCVNICAHGAPSITDKKATIDTSKCLGCGRCLANCPMDAIQTVYDAAPDNLNKRMAEYSMAICQDRPCFHISLIVDVSPFCDCHAENDAPIIPNLGMLASFDPVALDQACVDLVNATQPFENSVLGANMAKDPEGCKGHDHFHNTSPNSHWEMCLEHAQKIGLGTREYELIKMK
ncbi:MAG: DUF362 domain-containing protein [Phascolarctobacterium sp.]|nr:DUF362 domain-containing protein [Phascolarctobacterium sp.]